MIRAGWLALRPRYAYISHISPIDLPISRLYLRPRYAVCSVLHLVELRSQFAHSAALDTLKRNRDYVMQAS